MASLPCLEAALHYAERGWFVLPLFGIRNGACTCANPECRTPGKHPRTPHGLRDATCDPATIRMWFNRYPDSNLGIATGPSGLGVLDVDENKDGLASLRKLNVDTRAAGKVRTGAGWHLYFLGPAPTSAGSLGPGLDVRGVGGYVVAPPSRHQKDTLYEWVRSIEALPAWPFPNPAPRAVPIGDSIPEGTRNSHLFSLGSALHYRQVPGELLLNMLRIVNRELCKPPLGDDEVQDIAASIQRRPQDGRRQDENRSVPAEPAGGPP